MQITLNLASKVSESFNMVSKSKVYSETQENLFIVSPCKIKRQITYFQPTIGQTMHYPSKGKKWDTSRKLWTNVKTKTKQGKLQSCSSMSDFKGLSSSALPASAAGNTLFFSVCFYFFLPCLLLSMEALHKGDD